MRWRAASLAEVHGVRLRQPRRQPHQIHLHYHASIPFLDAYIKTESNGQAKPFKLLGTKGMMAECPPFLDKIVSRETSTLEKRLEQKKIDKHLFEEGLEYQFLKDGWALIQDNKPKKAMALFQKKYGIAIERRSIQHLFHVLHQIHKKTRPWWKILF